MSVAPIRHTILVNTAPSRAFDLFVMRIGDWWPKDKSIGKATPAHVVIEPRTGGRWFERDVAGNETQWGKVLAWAPPNRLLLAWQINSQWRYDPELVTEVEVTFASTDGGTRVTLEHRNLERYGADAERHAGRLDGGWPAILAEFARLTGNRN
jgi:uncharacterized protein YndB with AHSA1/START domain